MGNAQPAGGQGAAEVAASRKLLVFRLGEAAFGVALDRTVEVLRMVAHRPLAGYPPAVLGVIDYRGVVVLLVDLAPELGLPAQRPGLDSKIVIVERGGKPLGLVVEEIEGLLDVEPEAYRDLRRPLPEAGGPARRGCVEGAVRRAEGLVLVVEIDRVLSAQGVGRIARPVEAGAGRRTRRREP